MHPKRGRRVPVRGGMCCWFAPAAFLLDRVAKAWVQSTLAGRSAMEWWPGVLRLRYVENTGAAFGLLRGQPVLLSVITGALLIGLVAFMLTYGRTLPRLPSTAMWLLLGGAAGNLFDRIAYGYVVDFFEITLFRFPVFNVADICVCVAVFALIGWLFLAKKDVDDGG